MSILRHPAALAALAVLCAGLTWFLVAHGGAVQEALGGTLRAIALAQRDAQRELSALVLAIRQTGILGWPAALLVALSFGYGILHALGPGHGKLVIASYLLAEGGRAREGVALAAVSALAQAAAAILAVGVLAAIVGLSRPSLESGAMVLQRLSYVLIAGIGGWMLLSALRGRDACGHDHEGHGGHGRAQAGDGEAPAGRGARASRLARQGAVVLAVGIRPCTGAILVLLFTLAQGLLPVGIVATVMMAAGTATTVSALAVLAIASRQAAVAAGARAGRTGGGRAVAVVGAALVALVGLALLAGTLGDSGPPL